ncbi:MAG TPA: H-X9-DG-CTERM domain-containing protein [Armatimonadota bacterium]|jgi:prepilin-type processing-associated H-X9-DG protein
MPQTALDYIASLRAEGHRDADIAAALRGGGWTRWQVRYLLRGTVPPAAAPARRWLTRTLVFLGLLGLALVVIAGLLRVSAERTLAAPPAHPLLLPPGGLGDMPPSTSRAPCLAQVQRLMVAQLAYATDHENRFPCPRDWKLNLREYGVPESDFWCPDDARRRQWFLASYAMNQVCDGRWGIGPGDPHLVLLFDSEMTSGGPECARFRHDDGANVGFADGHCAWRYPSDFKLERFTPQRPRKVWWQDG